ncbi:MAG TPA: hypothetical protein VN999_11800, partial [Thermoanaerobaculia bacterium]|nr:hypothetical protein [Thermoanaerobaculia bacterium]
EGETGAPSTGSQVTSATLKDLLSVNKLNHIFNGEGHGLENLVANFGGEQQLTVKVVEQLGALGPLPTNSNGIFKVVVQIAGEVVTVTGKVVDGVARVGTFYVVR